MLTKEQRLALPKKRANRQEIDAIYGLAAYLSCLMEAAGDKDNKGKDGRMIEGVLASRARLIPGGYRNLRCIEVMTRRLVADMLYTLEPDKMRVIQKQIGHLRHKTVFGPQATKDPEMFLMPMGDLAYLIRAATEACKIRFCPASACKRCPLGKVLDGASYVSRGDRAWHEVFAAAERGDDPCAYDGD
jgi:hypothetical protein